MAVFDWLFGSSDQIKKMPAKSPEQMGALQQLIGSLGQMNPNIMQDPLYQQGRGQLSELLDPSEESFGRFAAPFMQQFQQQTMPGIVNRYADSSSKGSSSFQNAVSQAGVGLSTNLAALRSTLQQDALGKALQYSQQPVSNYSSLFSQGLSVDPFAYGKQNGQSGLIPSLLMALVSGIR